MEALTESPAFCAHFPFGEQEGPSNTRLFATGHSPAQLYSAHRFGLLAWHPMAGKLKVGTETAERLSA